MKKSFRLSIESAYGTALKTARIAFKKVTAHLDGTATVALNDKDAAKLASIKGLSVLGKSGSDYHIALDTAIEWTASNPPRLTDAERAAQEQERAARKEARAARRAERLAEQEDDFDPDLDEVFDETGDLD